MILAPRGAVEIGGEAAEMGVEKGAGLRAQIGAGADTERLHLARGDGADAVEAAYRQARDERRALGGWNDAQPVGLVLIRRQLGDELVVRNALLGRASCRERGCQFV